WRVVIDGQCAAEGAADLHMTTNAGYLAKARVLARLREEFRDLIDQGPSGPARGVRGPAVPTNHPRQRRTDHAPRRTTTLDGRLSALGAPGCLQPGEITHGHGGKGRYSSAWLQVL